MLTESAHTTEHSNLEPKYPAYVPRTNRLTIRDKLHARSTGGPLPDRKQRSFARHPLQGESPTNRSHGARSHVRQYQRALFFPLQWRKARSSASAEPIRSTNSRGLALFVLLTELGVSVLGSFYSGSLQELPSSLVGGETLDEANIAHSQRFLPIKTVEML